MKFLSDGSQVEVISHPSLNVVQGVVYEPDTIEFKEEDLLQLLQPQGITNVRRIKKRVGKVLKNTPLLVLNITGTVLPTHVFFGLLRVGVRQYYPTPMICRVCAQYGHIGKNCPNSEKPICLNCSANFHTTEDETCAKAAFCLHCKAGHSPMSKVCPKYQEEDEVIHLRIDKGLSFAEARKALADSKRTTTYAQELQNNLMEQKDKQIAELQRQLNDMRAQMKALCSSTGTVITRQRSRSRKPSPMLSKQHEKMPVTKTTDIREMDFENGRSKRQITTKYSCEGNSKKASYSQANKNDSNNEQIDVSETEHESDNDQFFRPRNGKITKNYHSTTR
ncbi:uncharacterized protein LOC129760094 [Uranotaenia lowii]|uniref:uncharacterized protein LOC129760094 n=2 Tax=Uranotaenia lowii TaxID=190385 RepID=UPI00247951DE|nr:uncharacterized protein LOC129760094 [Uranotaenia lowii]